MLIISHMTRPFSNINFNKIFCLTTLKIIMNIATSLHMRVNNNMEASKHVSCIRFMQNFVHSSNYARHLQCVSPKPFGVIFNFNFSNPSFIEKKERKKKQRCEWGINKMPLVIFDMYLPTKFQI